MENIRHWLLDQSCLPLSPTTAHATAGDTVGGRTYLIEAFSERIKKEINFTQKRRGRGKVDV